MPRRPAGLPVLDELAAICGAPTSQAATWVVHVRLTGATGTPPEAGADIGVGSSHCPALGGSVGWATYRAKRLARRCRLAVARLHRIRTRSSPRAHRRDLACAPWWRRHRAATIVIVEDEQDIAAALVTRLRSEGFESRSPATALAASRCAGAVHPDLVVLDLMLPGLDGLEVCRRIQAERRLPVLMLTARDAETDLFVGLAVGADDYLTKPFAPGSWSPASRPCCRARGATAEHRGRGCGGVEARPRGPRGAV